MLNASMRELISVRQVILLLGAMALLFASELAADRSLPDFSQLVEQHSAAVVNISTSQAPYHSSWPEQSGPDSPGSSEDIPFHDFLKRFFGEGEIEEFNAESLGSGFIISPDGYLLTNTHVVENADEITVRLSDRREFPARVIGADRRSDIALLKVDAQASLPVVKVGIGGDVKVGEWVLAIGSPFGLEHSVTAGIVSAKGRSLPKESYVPFIQTDVAINPGNSGGPLFNLAGEVVGVNSQIFSRTGGFMGLSFAIPIDVAMEVALQLRTKGHVSRGWLGVLIQEVTRDLAESFGMDKPAGALIAKVLTNSPAEQAGLQVGDIVLAFNEQPISHSSDLPPIVGRARANTQVPLAILRNGELRTIRVAIGELPDDDDSKSVPATRAEPSRVINNSLGLGVGDLAAGQREQYALPDHGVLVERVGPGPGQRAGVRKGDLVLMLNGIQIRDSRHFERLAAQLPVDRAVSALVQRGRHPLFLALRKSP